jgi:pimeloyl-ACP methyl ester carboxylesterase
MSQRQVRACGRVAAGCTVATVDARRWIGRTALGTGAVYVAALVLGHAVYRRLLYPAAGRADVAPPADARLLTCAALDGVAVHALEFGGATAERTIVYFHGNGEVVGDDTWIARELARRGFHVVLAEYRGYGLSAPGQPTEPGLYADAEAVLDALAARGIGPTRIALWGMSLGTGVAAEMARRGRGSALVLVAPYTSIVDVASHHVPFLPARLVMEERFDTLAKAPGLRVRALVLHGTRDEVVPFSMGRRVAERIPGATFIAVEGGHHNDLFVGPGVAYFDAAQAFIGP